MTITLLQGKPSCECLAIRDLRLELDAGHGCPIIEDAIPSPGVPTVRDRNFRAQAQPWTEKAAKRGKHPGVGRIPDGIPSGKGSHRQVEAHHGANPGGRHDVQPRREGAFDPAELGARDPDGASGLRKGQARSQASTSDLLAELGEESTTSAGSAGGVRLGHRRIVTAAAYRRIIGAATIAR